MIVLTSGDIRPIIAPEVIKINQAFCFFPVLSLECGKKGSASRIINGQDAGHGEFPWQISLRISPDIDPIGHICGGTLLNKVT